VKVVRPQRLLPVVTIVWGGVVLANGFIQNYGSLIGLRCVIRSLSISPDNGQDREEALRTNDLHDLGRPA